MRGYTKDSEFMGEWNSNHENYVLRSGFRYVKTVNAVKRLCVLAYDRLITANSVNFSMETLPCVCWAQLKVAQWYNWPNLNKAAVHARDGKIARSRIIASSCQSLSLKVLEIISMDFVTGLPVLGGFDAIMTVVDKLSERFRYAATHTNSDTPKVGKHILDVVVRHYGLRKVTISDRDPKFTSNLWKSLMAIMCLKRSMTTAHRACWRSDWATNLILKDALCCMVTYQHDDGSTQFGTIEFAYATLVSKSAELSPLEIVIAWQVSNTISGRFSGAGKKHPVAEYARYFPDKGQMIIKIVQINLAKGQENKRTTTTRRAVMWHLMLETWSTRHVKLRHHKMGHGTTKSTL